MPAGWRPVLVAAITQAGVSLSTVKFITQASVFKKDIKIAIYRGVIIIDCWFRQGRLTRRETGVYKYLKLIVEHEKPNEKYNGSYIGF